MALDELQRRWRAPPRSVTAPGRAAGRRGSSGRHRPADRSGPGGPGGGGRDTAGGDAATVPRRPGHRPQRGERIVGDLPAQTRSHSAASSSVSDALGAAARSWFQKLAPRSASATRIASWSAPCGGSRRSRPAPTAPAGRRSTPAPARRSTPIAPAPTHTHVAGRAQLVELALAVVLDPGRRARRARASTRRAARPASSPSVSTTASAPRRGGGDAMPRGEEASRTPPARPARPRGATRPASGGVADAALPCRTTRDGRRPGGTRRAPPALPTRAPPARGSTRGLRDAQSGDHLAFDERSVRAGVAADQLLQRARHGIGERAGQPHGDDTRGRRAGGRRRRPDRHPVVAAEAHEDGPPLGHQRVAHVDHAPPARRELGRASISSTSGGRRPGAGGRGAGRRRPPDGVGQALELQLDGRRARRRRAGRAALGAEQLPQSARSSDSGGPAARRAASRTRTCRRRSRPSSANGRRATASAFPPPPPASRGPPRRAAPPRAPARRRRPARTRGSPRGGWGSRGSARPRQQVGAALALLPQRGAPPGRLRGMTSARAAASRNHDVNSDDVWSRPHDEINAPRRPAARSRRPGSRRRSCRAGG